MPEEHPIIISTPDDGSLKGVDRLSVIRMISQAVMKLDGTRRNIQMYPEGHEAIQKSMEEATALLSKIFSLIPAIALTVEKESLFFGNDLLDMQQTGAREFLSILKLHDISFIQFQKELTPKELLPFLALFSGVKDSLGRHEESVKNRLLREFPHITVKFLDYSGLGLAIEEKVSGPAEQIGPRRHGAMSGQGSSAPQGGGGGTTHYVIEGKERAEQDSLYSLDTDHRETLHASAQTYAHTSGGHVINIEQEGESAQPNDPPAAGVPADGRSSVTDYEALLSTYLNRLGEMGSDSPEASPGSDPDMDERVQLYEKRLEAYLNHPRKRTGELLTPREHTTIIQTFLKNLNPALKKQFESFDFDKLLQNERALSFENLLEGDDLRTTFDALRQANEENKEISPTLITLVKKMFAALGEYDSMGKQAGQEDTGRIKDQVEKLFERETYEKFVVDAYEKRLKQLSGSSADQIAKDHSFSLEKCLQTLEEGHITRQITHALTALIEEEKSPDIYKDYLNCLLIISMDLLKYDAFDWLETVYALFKRHGEAHPDAKIMVAAQKGSAHFVGQSFISRILDAMKSDQEERARRAKAFFMILGGDSVPALLTLFFQSASPLEGEVLIHYLEIFRKETLFNLGQVLSSPDLFLSDHLITLMIRFKDKSIAPFFKRLLTHEDPDIQEQAVELLLEHGDSDAIDRVRCRIFSKDMALSLAAIEQAGRFRLSLLAPALEEELTRHLLLMPDIEKKKVIVSALGAIGDPSALPVFETIAKKSFSLKARRLNELKAVVFQSLERFPRHAISNLIAIGKRLKDPQVQAALETLSGEHRVTQSIEKEETRFR
jgi:hypothetical protein